MGGGDGDLVSVGGRLGDHCRDADRAGGPLLVVVAVQVRLNLDGLDLLHLGGVPAHLVGGVGGQGVVALGAHAGRAVDAAPAAVALAEAGLARVPVDVRAVGVGLVLDGGVGGDLGDVLAGAVAVAAVGAGAVAARVAGEPVVARALAGLAVADAVVGALGVVVRELLVVGDVAPGAAEEARALRAVEALVARVAGAHVVVAAFALARAVVRARRGGDAEHGGGDENLGDGHFWPCIVFFPC